MADEEKKKVIIALWGPQDTGKTTTLRKLALEFLDSPEVKDDIQVGFLYYEGEGSKKRRKKMAMSITGDDKAAVFAETLKATLLSQRDEIRSFIDSVKPDKQISASCESNEPLNSDEIITLYNLLGELLELKCIDADIQIAFHYKGKRIVISTAGDDGVTVKEGADLFKALKADILVTATRSENNTKGKASKNALEDLETDDDVLTKAVWIYKSYLTYSELNRGKKGEPLKESITKEQIEIIRNTINEQQAKILKATIDLIIDKWEEQSEDNSSSSDPVT